MSTVSPLMTISYLLSLYNKTVPKINIICFMFNELLVLLEVNQEDGSYPARHPQAIPVN